MGPSVDVAKDTNAASPASLDEPQTFGAAMCMAPFVNLAVAIGGGASPCCLFSQPLGDVKRQSIPEIWTSDGFDALRRRLKDETRDPRCARCYRTEVTGGMSLRNVFNREFAHQAARLEPDLAVPPPVSLDVRFSNLCNFSCRTCYHGASTKWFADAKKLGWQVAPDALIPTFTSSEAGIAAIVPLLGTVEKIYFAGGEPLLHEQHYAILARLLALGRTDARLEYNSNLSELTLSAVDVLDVWSRFRSVKIGISIDGSGARGELIRKGLDWDAFVANVRMLKARCPHVLVRFDITISVFNIAVLEDLSNQLTALGFTDPHLFRYNVLLEPTHYSIQILPQSMKRPLAASLRRFADRLDGPSTSSSPSLDYGAAAAQLRHVVDHMLHVDRTDEIVAFRRVVGQLDALRREDTLAVCPELAPLLKPGWLSRQGHALRKLQRRLRPRVAGSQATG